MNRKGLHRMIATACILSSVAVAGAQGLRDTLWIPAIFYDFHPSLSNPNFQGVDNIGTEVLQGMVQDSLDADRKPVLRENKEANDRISEWFRPSGADGSDPKANFVRDQQGEWTWTNLVPRPGGTEGEFVSPSHNPDYEMANVVIYDSLPFVRRDDLGEGIYQFSRTGAGEPQFFWIDNRGFGNELGSDHNFAFTMELHREFTYQPGLTLDFNGDDDVWVFVDNQLVLDIGGIHRAANDNFALDDYAEQLGLEQGKKYSFDFFYAERQTTQSTIRMTTNLLSPLTFELIVRNDTVSAGSLARVDAIVRNSSGIRHPEKESQTTWQLLDPSAPGDTITNLAGASTELGGTKAYRRVMVKATYEDPDDPDYTLEGRAFVYVGPGPPSHIWIERLTHDSVTSLNEPDTVERISLDPAEDSARAYAVLRDLFGNYVDFARKAQWHSDSPGAIAVSPREGSNWVGIITRGDAPNEIDSTVVTASWEGLDSDRVRVVAEGSLQAAHPRFFSAADPGSGERRMYDLKGRVVLRRVVPGEGRASFHSMNIARPPTIPGGVYCVGNAGGLIRRVIAAE